MAKEGRVQGVAWPSILQEGLSPVEAVIGPVGQREDGRVGQLPHPRLTHLLTRTEAQVGDLEGVSVRERGRERERRGSQ